MSVFIGNKELKDCLIGNLQVNKIYSGSNLVWEKGGGGGIVLPYPLTDKEYLTVYGFYVATNYISALPQFPYGILLKFKEFPQNEWTLQITMPNDTEINKTISANRVLNAELLSPYAPNPTFDQSGEPDVFASALTIFRNTYLENYLIPTATDLRDKYITLAEFSPTINIPYLFSLLEPINNIFNLQKISTFANNSFKIDIIDNYSQQSLETHEFKLDNLLDNWRVANKKYTSSIRRYLVNWVQVDTYEWSCTDRYGDSIPMSFTGGAINLTGTILNPLMDDGKTVKIETNWNKYEGSDILYQGTAKVYKNTFRYPEITGDYTLTVGESSKQIHIG